MNIHAIFDVILPPFRKRRMREFMKAFLPVPQTKILDVGGTPMNWMLVNSQSQITLLNLDTTGSANQLPANFNYVIGDGVRLNYPDGEFDICFSNSVIEHVGSLEDQHKFADEVRRVGRGIWVQTPARSFFFEPHLLTPFIHFLPKNIQRKLLRNFTVWGLLTRPDEKRVDQFLSETRLLSYDEMKALFPDCEIRIEKLLFFTKAFVAVRRW
jgi:hypothetical protein